MVKKILQTAANINIKSVELIVVSLIEGEITHFPFLSYVRSAFKAEHLRNHNLHNKTDLLSRLASGDEDAFRTLFHQYFRPLCFFANSFVHDVEAAKDLTQEVLYKLWIRRENFPTQENIKAFLYISVKNACINYLKAVQRRTQRHQEIMRRAEQDDGFTELLAIKEELLQKIVTEIESLPDKYSNIIRLSFVEGLNHQQIAERLNISEATVRKQKERGLKLLKTIVVKKRLGMVIAYLIGVMRI